MEGEEGESGESMGRFRRCTHSCFVEQRQVLAVATHSLHTNVCVCAHTAALLNKGRYSA